MTKTIEKKLVNLYDEIEIPQIYQKEKDALCKILGSVRKEPRDLYTLDNAGKIIIKDHSIHSLDISEIGLKKVPPEIKEFKRMEYLYLNGNKLKSLPPEILRIRKLKYFYVNDNPLNEESRRLCRKLEQKKVIVYY